MLRSSLFFFVVALLMLTSAACEQNEQERVQAVALVDALGRAVEMTPPAARVLSLAPNLTEIIYAIGAGDRLVAASQADTYPPQVRDLPAFSSFPPDHERIVELNPDLLFATDEINSPTDADALARVGVATYFFSFADIASVPAAIRTAGGLLGVDGEPAAMAFEATIDSVRQATEGQPSPSTLLLVGDDVLYAFGRESYASEAIRAAGGENLTDAFDGRSAVVSEEFVLENRPEVIIVLSDEAYSADQLLQKHPTWSIIPAVEDGRVYGIHPDLLSRPGPRLAKGIAEVAERLHPAPVESR